MGIVQKNQNKFNRISKNIFYIRQKKRKLRAFLIIPTICNKVFMIMFSLSIEGVGAIDAKPKPHL